MPLQDKIGHLQADTVLVREDIPFPDTIRVSTSVLEVPWCVLKAIRPVQPWAAALRALCEALLGRIEQAHWQVFFVPPDVRAKAFGYGRTSALARALREILTKADLAALNAVKIASITAKQILGIQFACIEARLRHIQHGLILTAEKQGTKPSATTGLRTPYPKPCAAIVSYLVLRTRRALVCRTSDGTAIPENEEIWISPGF